MATRMAASTFWIFLIWPGGQFSVNCVVCV
jgi:hypothetical protein